MGTALTTQLNGRSLVIAGEIASMLNAGHSVNAIMQSIGNKYNIKTRQCIKHVANARTLIKAQTIDDIDAEKAIAKNRLNDAVLKSAENQDYRTLVVAQRELDAINGLHEPKSITVNIFASHPVDTTRYLRATQTAQEQSGSEQDITVDIGHYKVHGLSTDAQGESEA
jgi:hypothetical protein